MRTTEKTTQKTPLNSPFFRPGGIALKLIATTALMFLAIIVIVVGISYKMYKDAFYNYGNQLCLTSNALAAYAIDGDLVERFAKNLTVDKDYVDFADRLDALSRKIHAKYFYILADRGNSDTYTYIYDATHPQEFPGERYALGRNETKAEYDGAAEVLATGKSFDKAFYYNDKYGELYYAYAPIFNSKGKVVAFLGTDVDITPLHAQVTHYRLMVFISLIIALLLFCLLYFVILRHILTRPLLQITSSAINLAQGNLNLSFSPKMLTRRDEIGYLADSFRVMAQSITSLVLDIKQTMQAARDGRLDVRIDPARYEGDYRRIISGVNNTRNMINRHLDAIPEGIAFFDSQQNMLYANKTMCSFIELHSLSENNSSLPEKIISAGNEPELDQKIKLLFTGSQYSAVSTDICLNTPNSNEPRNYSAMFLNVEPEVSGSGQICIMLVLADTTQLIQAKNEAEAASRAKSDFLSRMSHEIRTPLNAIMGMTQIMGRSKDLQKIENCMRQIAGSSHHLLGIINDILDFSKIEAGKMVLEAHEFSLSQNLEFVVSMVLSKANEDNISIATELSLAHDYIVADSLRLNQVLLNILSNAVKFSHPNGRIELKLEEILHEDGLSVFKFTVEDHGIGMSETQTQQLFKPFEQADASISRNYGGTGLGLVIAKSIALAMGGDLGFESKLGVGSTFFFTIHVPARATPLNAETPALPLTSDISPPLADFFNKKMLIVDDIDINRMIILELLADCGMIMDEATNGQEAIEMFEKSPLGYYDFILMDMQMPVLDGCEATRAIRTLNRPDADTVWIIAMTANVMREDVEKALAAGMNAHVGKPIDLNILLTSLKQGIKD